MAHEVVKHVGSRAYRYRVESYRDPATGKVRGRWTYLGRVTGSGTEPPRRTTRELTRERLLTALEALLERHDYAAMTAAEIAEEAGLAHGTFYRYFRDKGAALREAIERVRAAVDREHVALATQPGSLERERARVRRWARAVMGAPVERPGLLRAWFALTDADPQAAQRRSERREHSVESLASYLERCVAAGLVRDLAHPRALATALLSLFDGVLRGAATGRASSREAIEGVLDVFDRAIFGTFP